MLRQALIKVSYRPLILVFVLFRDFAAASFSARATSPKTYGFLDFAASGQTATSKCGKKRSLRCCLRVVTLTTVVGTKIGDVTVGPGITLVITSPSWVEVIVEAGRVEITNETTVVGLRMVEKLVIVVSSPEIDVVISQKWNVSKCSGSGIREIGSRKWLYSRISLRESFRPAFVS